MSIQDLLSILPPPAYPIDAKPEEDWATLPINLPSDYKMFICKYGTGVINQFLWIFNPFASNRNVNLIEQIEVKSSALRQLRASGELIPYSIFPEHSGLLPLGATDNGDVLYWNTHNDTDSWSVVINGSRDQCWVEYERNTTSFLGELLRGMLRPDAFPKLFWKEFNEFQNMF